MGIFFLNLEKLDLRSMPWTQLPSWLNARDMKKLKKLYISVGGVSGLHKVVDQNWTVEILNLKFLKELEMDWGE